MAAATHTGATLSAPQVIWVEPTYHAVHATLTHPAYAGAYVYGRTRGERYVTGDGDLRTRRRRVGRDEWEVCIPDHHQGSLTGTTTWSTSSGSVRTFARSIAENPDGADKLRKQPEFLVRIREGAAVAGITVDVAFDGTIHDRSIVTDTRWKILLGRGLDVFQYVTGDAFDLASKLQQYCHVKAFGLTYIRGSE